MADTPLQKMLWDQLGEFVDAHGDTMKELQARYGAGEVEASASAVSMHHEGKKFKLSFIFDPDTDEDDDGRYQ